MPFVEDEDLALLYLTVRGCHAQGDLESHVIPSRENEFSTSQREGNPRLA